MEELPAGALCVRRVDRPADSGFMNIWLVGWFGSLLCMGKLAFPLWFILTLGLMGGLWFWVAFDTTGLGKQVWHAEQDLLSVRRSFLGWSQERRYTGGTLQIAESKDSDSHTLELTVRNKKGGNSLIHTNHPSPEQRTDMDELGRRLAEATGWKLVS